MNRSAEWRRRQEGRGRTLFGRALRGLMLLGLLVICNGVPAQAQTDEKGANLVDTAAVLTRLHSGAAESLALSKIRREQVAEASLSSRRTEPALGETVADGASGKEAVPNSTQSSMSTGASTGPKFQLTPYIWFSGIKGAVGAGTRVATVDVRIRDIIDEVNFGFSTTFEVQWGGRWRFLTDIYYSNLSDDNATPGPTFDGVQSVSKTFILDPEIGYAIVANEATSVDVLVGIRYWHLKNELEFRRGADRLRFTGTADWVDLVGGVRAKAALSKAIYLVAKADVGGLGSDLTYQLLGGLGINFSPRITSIFGYRYLDVNYRGGNAVYDVALHGIITGFGFRF